MSFHKEMAILTGALILMHPLLLALGDRSWSLFGLNTSWPITVGKAGLLLLVLTVLLALFFRKLRMDYNTWRFIHKGAILVVILGFVHSLLVGSDLQGTGMKAYWTALFSISILLFLFRNVYVPLFGKQRLKVATVSRESHDTKDHWETRAGTSYLLTSNFSLLGQWHSEFGCGSGLRWQF